MEFRAVEPFTAMSYIEHVIAWRGSLVRTAEGIFHDFQCNDCNVYMYIYVYIHIYVYIYTYIYVYTYIRMLLPNAKCRT